MLINIVTNKITTFNEIHKRIILNCRLKENSFISVKLAILVKTFFHFDVTFKLLFICILKSPVVFKIIRPNR